ncbi:hypothetical protein CH252_32995 [Rhodococcus sp. 06-1477-1B]|nr:hypothetical protein CH252_32995 [Rhodococcus sp. 06-1477-1B]
MYLNPNLVPAPFLLEATKTTDLGAKATQAREHLRVTQTAQRAASDAFRAIASGPVDDPRPHSGITVAELNAAVDAHRAASAAESAAQRAYQRALKVLHDAIHDAMATDDFLNKQEPLADAAQDAAVEAVATLRDAIADRDLADKLIGRRRDLSGIAHQVAYVIRQLELIVEAPIADERQRAWNAISDSVMTSADAAAAARKAGLIQ